MTSRHRLGELGEELARVFLMMCGYRFLQGRFRLPGGEIDLVMEVGRTVVFVEVKTRRRGAAARPEECVTFRQLLRLRRAAGAWLTANRAWGRRCRFDVVAVEMGGVDQGLEIRHFADVGGIAK